MDKEYVVKKCILDLSKAELATRFEFRQRVYYIDSAYKCVGGELHFDRFVSPTEFLIADVSISVFTGSVDCRIFPKDAKNEYLESLEVSGNLVWATEKEALAMIDDLNVYCNKIDALRCDNCGTSLDANMLCCPVCQSPTILSRFNCSICGKPID